MKNQLFSPLTLRGITFKNRIFVSPMCQYSSEDSTPNAWHFVHYGSRAVGGAACIIQEATAVAPEGRISPGDLGLWSDAQVAAFRPLAQFIKENGAVPCIQLAHAGRKASASIPWKGNGPVAIEAGGWAVVAPSAAPFDAKSPVPRELSEQEIQAVVVAFAKAAERSLAAGYEAVELHAAHGYLLHQFLSPLSNQRTDRYGGNLENRMRLVLEVASAVRQAWPDSLPLLVRISASDWVEGGWDVRQSVVLCAKLKEIGVDLIDVSTGGVIPGTRIPSGPGYQVPFADAIRQGVQIPVGTVGRITTAEQAEQIVANHQADVVLLARELLRDPYWPLHAAHALGEDIAWPKQYERAKP
ncbi:MAG: NADH:flavin oxidoreductase/NADH oxidase [Alphaproteobacteria bacterium]|nr:NADH:flavin oxidoreductase/NADH oxidase [Alphaproteobacteria bacterium]